MEKEIEAENTTEDNLPKLDLKFKEGQTIKVNLNIAKKSSSKPKASKTQGTGILLPPPPGASSKTTPSAGTASKNSFEDDLDFGLAKLSVEPETKTSSSTQDKDAPSGWAQF